MSWKVDYLPEAIKDFNALAGNQQLLVRKAVQRTAQNPLPRSEGGYGIPLGHKGNRDLTNFLEIKLRGAGLRAVYKLVRTETAMLVLVIGAREDEVVYDVTLQRVNKYGL